MIIPSDFLQWCLVFKVPTGGSGQPLPTPVNNEVLVTDGSGNVLWSQLLPTGITCATPTAPTQLANKQYVDNAVFNQVNLPISNYLTSTLGISVGDGFSIVDNGSGRISTPYVTSSSAGISIPDLTTLGISSGNGTSYTQSNITSDSVVSATYGNKIYVAVSRTAANVYYSSNGTSWTLVTLSGTGFNKVAYGNGLFVACNNTSGLWYSSNGSSWTQVGATSAFGFNYARFADGIWVALSLGQGIWYSASGTSWTKSASFTSFSGAYEGLAFNGNTWVAISNSNGGIVYSTDNGTTWTASNQATGTFGGIAAYNGRWVAVGNNSNGIYYSSNGITWTQSASLTTASFDFVLVAQNVWLASGHSSNGLFYSTNSGQTWAQVTGAPTSVNCHDTFYANGLFVAAFGQSSGIYYSTDGITWTQATGSTTNTMNAVIYAAGVWIVTADTVGIWYSKTGILSVLSSPAVTATATSTNANYFLTFVPSSTTGSQSVFMNSGLYYNPSTKVLNNNGPLSLVGSSSASAVGISGTWTNGIANFGGTSSGARDAFIIGPTNTYNGTDVFGLSLIPTVQPANATPSTAKSTWLYPQFNIGNGIAVSSTYGLHVDGGSYTLTGTGSIGTAYNLYVSNPPAGTNKVAAFLANMAIGYTGVTPPSNGAIIQGVLGVGTSSPGSTYAANINGLSYSNNAYKQDGTASSGSAITLSSSQYSQRVTLNAATVTITMPALPASGSEVELLVELIQDATGGRAVTWAVSPTLTWASGSPPNINTISNTSTYLTFRGVSTGWVGFASSTGLGVTNAANAAAGYIGEIVTSTVASGSAVSLTTNTAANITSIVLSPGNWVISGNIVFVPAGTTAPTQFIGSANSTSATQATAPNGGCYFQQQATFTTGAQQAFSLGQTVVQITATTTYYLVATATFTVSTMTAYGSITAGRYY